MRAQRLPIYILIRKFCILMLLFEIMSSHDSSFVSETLRDGDISQPVQLLCDRQRISPTDHTDQIWSITFNFDSKLFWAFHNWISIMNTTAEYLAFTSYYIFLFKLTNGQRDLCVGRNIIITHQLESQFINM